MGVTIYVVVSTTAAAMQSSPLVYAPFTQGFSIPSGSSIHSKPSFTMAMANMDYPYVMPTSLISCLQTNTSMFIDNANTVLSPLHGFAISVPCQNTRPSLTASSLQCLRHQMDKVTMTW